jgi:hypothetical protein
MANTLRSQSNIWNAAVVGANGISPAVDIGVRTNVALFVASDTATNITILCSPGTGGSGRNSFPDDDAFYTLFKDDGSAAYTIAVPASATGVCIDLSPFAPQYIKLKTSAAATLTAGIDVVG